jgi:hypothetical protein
MENKIEEYDNFINYSVNVDVNEFVQNFYDGKFDYYVQNKIHLMKNDFISFWYGLDKINKNKYIKLVKTYYEK